MSKVRVAGTFLFLVLFGDPAWASPACTLVARADTGKVLAQDGPCDVRNSPASTFKVALALMGYDAGILVDAHTPTWPYHEEYNATREGWKTSTDPTSWLRDSVVWYSQILVKNLGAARFEKYVNAFGYGNGDLTGAAKETQNGPLFPAVWINSTLRISPLEEVAFLRKLLNNELPVSRRAMDLTRTIVPTFQASDGWIVHGKTGTGYRPDESNGISDRQFGWFVGWATRASETVVFARLIKDDEKTDAIAGFRARDSFLTDLPQLIEVH